MTPKECMRHVYETYAARDLEASLSAFAPDALYVQHPADLDVPFAGEFRGVEALRARLVHLADVFEFLSFDVIEMVAEDNKVASRLRTRVHNKQTNVEIEIDLVHFVTLRDGQITEFHEYADSALVNFASINAEGLPPD